MAHMFKGTFFGSCVCVCVGGDCVLIRSLVSGVLAQGLFAAAVTGNGSPERSGFS